MTKQNVIDSIKRFEVENNRLPRTSDFDSCEYLLNSRTIQRKFGGLKTFGIDNRKTKERSDRALNSIKLSKKQEDRLYIFLVQKYGVKNVHREEPYNGYGKVRSDFTVYYSKNTDDKFSIDVFYPNTKQSFLGCINIKLAKYNFSKLDYPVYFVNMNRKISETKNNLPKNVEVISFKELFVKLK